jgi:gliding motility-associated-like protein/uncharacterized repeat protein (TIGR01451 family)
MGQITLKIVLDPDQVTYRVYMSSAVSYTGVKSRISSSQVTVSVPHGVGADRFLVTNISSPVPGMRWILSGRVDAPRENPDRDYLFFSFLNTSTPVVQFDIVPGQDYFLFEFKRSGNCIGSAQMFDNATDEFRTPNSMGVNAGNSLSILGALGNVYKTNAEAPPTLTVTASASAVCPGEKITLKAAPSTPPISASAAYTYQWFADDQALGPVSTSPDFTYLAPGRSLAYQARLRVKMFIKGSTTCAGQFVAASQAILVKPKPTASLRFTGDPCTVLPTTLTADAVPGATYQWLLETQEVPGATGASLTVTSSGNYAVRLVLNECAATSRTQEILGQRTDERVTIRIPSVGQVVGGTPVWLQPVVSNAASFSWSPTNGLSSATVVNPKATPAETTTYTLTARNSSGCPATDTVTVRVIPPLYIPDAFSPNHDYQNDTWVIRNVQFHPQSTVSIFNRWGSLVFQSVGYAQPWDGQVAGTEAESGLYLYTIKTPFAYYEGRLMLLR